MTSPDLFPILVNTDVESDQKPSEFCCPPFSNMFVVVPPRAAAPICHFLVSFYNLFIGYNFSLQI